MTFVLRSGFQTTYEELKLFLLSVMLYPPLCFQTTYEELKLGVWTGLNRFPRSASRLPMRNWNYHYPCKSTLPSRFQTTYEELKQLSGRELDLLKQLPDYLWGIETRLSRLRPWHPARFQTTYEELKPFRELDASGIEPASRLPMRNWNYGLSGAT